MSSTELYVQYMCSIDFVIFLDTSTSTYIQDLWLNIIMLILINLHVHFYNYPSAGMYTSCKTFELEGVRI